MISSSVVDKLEYKIVDCSFKRFSENDIIMTNLITLKNLRDPFKFLRYDYYKTHYFVHPYYNLMRVISSDSYHT